MLKKIFFTSLLILILITPLVLSAQGILPSRQTVPNYTTFTPGGTNPQVCFGNTITNVLCTILQILNTIIPVLIALGVVYFVWGVVQYVIGSDEEAKKRGKDRIIFGIIGLTVIVGLWGIIYIVINTFGLNTVSNPNISSLQSPFDESIQNSNECRLVSNPKLQNLLGYATCIITNSIIPLLFALAVLMFIWGVIQFVITDSEEAKSKGKDYMIWGIIALAVMISIWGLVAILGNTFNINTGVIPQLREQP